MKPSEKYSEYLQQSGFYPDQSQQDAISLLDRLQADLVAGSRYKNQIIPSIFRKLTKNKYQQKGLYFWGGVGRGKTFLMDIFYECLPIKHKKRFHFHHFMKQIHDELAQDKNRKDPIKEIARQLSQQTQVLCLDEFVVIDIGDAMLIGRLLEAMFSHGLVLVTTSNTPPEELYKEGLQRERFLPAIDCLLQHCHITNLDGGRDYRQLGLQQTVLFQVPHDASTIASIQEYLQHHLVSGHQQGKLNVNDREISYEYRAEDTIWFDFAELCNTARSRFDYLEIAREFQTVILTAIKPMDDQVNDVTRRFISLIDVLYDHRVKLICSAEVPIEQLYQDKFLHFEFQRTQSRLREMQSLDYIGQSHLL